MQPARDRWPELDGVRGFAAVLVVYAHLFLMWVPGPAGVGFWLRTITGLAWTGVYLFFVLSGFLIGGILLQQRTAPNYYRVFYARRALRILPGYFLLLAVYLVARATPWLSAAPGFSSTSIPVWSYLLLVQNFPMALTGDWGAPPLGPTWSVALEEQFYLFLPLCVRLVPVRAQVPLFLCLAAAGPAFRALAPLAHSPFLMPGSSEALFAGVLLAWAHRERPEMFRAHRWRAFAAAALALGGLGMLLTLVQVRLGVWRITAITLFWSGFLWLVLSAMGTRWTALLRSRPLCGVGFISYGVYLFHALVYHSLFQWLAGGPPRREVGATGVWIAGLSTVVVILLATLLYLLLERRLMAFGRSMRYHAGASSDAVAPPPIPRWAVRTAGLVSAWVPAGWPRPRKSPFVRPR